MTTKPCAAPECEGVGRNGRYCGMHRSRLTRHGDFSKFTLTHHVCVICAKQFTVTKQPNAKTCSVKCGNIVQERARRSVAKQCVTCGVALKTSLLSATRCRSCAGKINAAKRSRDAACKSCGRTVTSANPWQRMCTDCAYRRRIIRTVKRNSRRKALRRGALGPTHTEKDWERLLSRHGGMCAYCKSRPAEHRDHVVPISRGGADSIGNILPACATCNLTKGMSLLIEWRNRRAA